MEDKKVYEFGSYDKYGNLNSKYFIGMIFLIFIISYSISFIVVDFIKQIFNKIKGR